MKVQRGRSGEGTRNMEKQLLYLGIVSIALLSGRTLFLVVLRILSALSNSVSHRSP